MKILNNMYLHKDGNITCSSNKDSIHLSIVYCLEKGEDIITQFKDKILLLVRHAKLDLDYSNSVNVDELIDNIEERLNRNKREVQQTKR